MTNLFKNLISETNLEILFHITELNKQETTDMYLTEEIKS